MASSSRSRRKQSASSRRCCNTSARACLESAMKLQSSRSRDEPEINVISLVDVLLVLVLFFMVSTTFLRETELNVRLPQAAVETRLDATGNGLEISITQ